MINNGPNFDWGVLAFYALGAIVGAVIVMLGCGNVLNRIVISL